MSITEEPPPWRYVVLATNGIIVKVSLNITISPVELTDLFYAALEKFPDALIAMELALDKYKSKKP